MSVFEDTLRSQRESWREIAARVACIDSGELSPEPPRRVLLFGLGSSHYVARLVVHTLIRDRNSPRVPLLACTALAIGTEVVPQPGDWAVGLSHRGRNKLTLDALEICARSGAFTILVSAQGVAEPERADLILEAGPLEKCEPHSIAITGAVCAATTLLLGAQAAAEWNALSQMDDPNLQQCAETVGSGPTIILGEHVAEWVAKEGALKFIEVCRTPVRAYGSEEFFHGTSWMLTPEDRTWHVSLPNDPRNSTILADKRLPVSGDTPLAWVPALVQLQWYALALALNLGVDPDDPIAASKARLGDKYRA